MYTALNSTRILLKGMHVSFAAVCSGAHDTTCLLDSDCFPPHTSFDKHRFSMHCLSSKRSASGRLVCLCMYTLQKNSRQNIPLRYLPKLSFLLKLGADLVLSLKRYEKISVVPAVICEKCTKFKFHVQIQTWAPFFVPLPDGCRTAGGGTTKCLTYKRCLIFLSFFQVQSDDSSYKDAVWHTTQHDLMPSWVPGAGRVFRCLVREILAKMWWVVSKFCVKYLRIEILVSTLQI